MQSLTQMCAHTSKHSLWNTGLKIKYTGTVLHTLWFWQSIVLGDLFSLSQWHNRWKKIILNNIPWTVSVVLTLLDPATLAAMHVYWPASSGWANAICRAPELRMRWRRDSVSACPSLCQVMSGGGKPSASHSRETGLSTAVTYSFWWELMAGGTKRQKVETECTDHLPWSCHSKATLWGSRLSEPSAVVWFCLEH